MPKINGNITLESDEQIWNSADGEVEIQFDDDAATLGNLILSSSMTTAEIEDNDLYKIIFRSIDGKSNETDYGEIHSVMTDTTHEEAAMRESEVY